MNLRFTTNLIVTLAAAEVVAAGKGKGSDSELPEYEPQPASDFEGTFKYCYGSVIRNTAATTGTSSTVVGTFHLCADDSDTPPPFDKFFAMEFESTSNECNAYEAKYLMPPNGFANDATQPITMKFQGFASENVIKMRSFGAGSTQDEAVIFENNTPDDLVCSLFRDQVMECNIQFTEYCADGDSFCTDVGTWFLSYSLHFVYAADTDDCPSPPDDFCSSNTLPTAPLFPGGDRRHLKNSKGSGGCPFASKGTRKV